MGGFYRADNLLPRRALFIGAGPRFEVVDMDRGWVPPAALPFVPIPPRGLPLVKYGARPAD